eukprot:3502001-Amphidinium_carterae.1
MAIISASLSCCFRHIPSLRKHFDVKNYTHPASTEVRHAPYSLDNWAQCWSRQTPVSVLFCGLVRRSTPWWPKWMYGCEHNMGEPPGQLDRQQFLRVFKTYSPTSSDVLEAHSPK